MLFCFMVETKTGSKMEHWSACRTNRLNQDPIVLYQGSAAPTGHCPRTRGRSRGKLQWPVTRQQAPVISWQAAAKQSRLYKRDCFTPSACSRVAAYAAHAGLAMTDDFALFSCHSVLTHPLQHIVYQFEYATVQLYMLPKIIYIDKVLLS